MTDDEMAARSPVFAGRQLTVHERPGKGPPVVFLNGCAVAAALWRPVLEQLDGAHLVTFDRPGLGTPWPGELPRLDQEVDSLIALIELVGGPVLLVAHSMAAFHAEALVRLRPDLVSGVVMVDGSVEWLGRRPRPAPLWPARAAYRITSTPVLRWTGGLAHRIGVRLQSANSLPAQTMWRFHQLYSDPDSVAMGLAETVAYAGQAWDLLQVRADHPMPEVPVRVLSATQSAGWSPKSRVPRHWRSTQQRWARLLGGEAGSASQSDVEGSRHMMMLDRPDAVVAAINEVRSAS